MQIFSRLFTALLAIISSPLVAQSDVWDGLARTTFDIENATLRIPCVVLKDGTGQTLPGYPPAYALNLQLEGETLRLVEPIQSFEELPLICLDTLTVDGNIATYSTESAQSNSNLVENTNRFYTLELQTTIPTSGPIDFSVQSAQDRLYIRPSFEGNSFSILAGISPYPREFVYDDALLENARNLILDGITVYEAGNLEIQCDFHDPLNLLEVVGEVGDNIQYRIKSSLTSADNNKTFAINCTAFNRDINQHEFTIPIVQWLISIS